MTSTWTMMVGHCSPLNRTVFYIIIREHLDDAAIAAAQNRIIDFNRTYSLDLTLEMLSDRFGMQRFVLSSSRRRISTDFTKIIEGIFPERKGDIAWVSSTFAAPALLVNVVDAVIQSGR